jgi:hypothetical protein
MALFNENSNKHLIWNMLLQNGTFNKLTNEQKPHITKKFDEIVEEISVSEPHETLVNKNKQLILKVTEETNTLYNSTPRDKKTPITSAEIINMRQEEFTDTLKSKQSEFDTFMTRPIPNDIDFSDKVDQPIGNSLDTMMSQAMANREIDLNTNFPAPKPKTRQQSTNNFVTNLVIGDQIDISSDPIKVESHENVLIASMVERLSALEETQKNMIEQLNTIYTHIIDSKGTE